MPSDSPPRVLVTPHHISGQAVGHLVLEEHRYSPGRAGTVPPHAHTDLQVGLSVNFPGEYVIGGRVFAVPAGSLSVIEPGRPHSARDPFDRPFEATYLTAYLPREYLREVMDGLGVPGQTPRFRDPVIDDPELAARFARWHALVHRQRGGLDCDEALVSLLSTLMGHGGIAARGTPVRTERRAVRRARSYIEAHLRTAIPLATLAHAAGVSPFHLVRAFRADVGLTPHAYLLTLRVDAARRLLAAGVPPASAALEVGFCDQSHLSRHFVRLIGTTPGRYAAVRKIVQDRPSA